ncbi:MAG: tetratricopeptide repeat protein [Myxococcota bacterium]|nr:tetratricopeptide repeat protein [Myxococcota bacterium]
MRVHLKAIGSVGFLCVCLLSVSMVCAQEVSIEEKREKAQAYFQRGELLVEEGKYIEAADAFTQAYETMPHPSVLANVAYCYDKAGNIPKAVEIFRKYMKLYEGEADTEAARERLQELKQRIGEIQITCPADPCQVTIDGMVSGEAPFKAILDPGVHWVEAVAGDTVYKRISVTVQEEHTVVLAMTPAQPEIQNTPAPPNPQEMASVPRVQSSSKIEKQGKSKGKMFGVPFWVASGTTIAALGVTVVFGVRTLTLRNDYNDSGYTDNNLKEDGEQAKKITNIMTIVTGASAATACVFGILDVLAHRERKQAARNTRISLVPERSGAVISLNRQF